MSALEIVAIVALVVLTGLAGTQVPGIWRSDPRTLRQLELGLRPSWPYSHVLWRGVTRGFPLVVASAVFLCVGVMLVMFPGLDGVFGPSSRVSDGLLLLMAAGFSICLLLHITVMFLNWPKWAVPPARRRESGALNTWLSKRGGRDRPSRPKERS